MNNLFSKELRDLKLTACSRTHFQASASNNRIILYEKEFSQRNNSTQLIPVHISVSPFFTSQKAQIPQSCCVPRVTQLQKPFKNHSNSSPRNKRVNNQLRKAIYVKKCCFEIPISQVYTCFVRWYWCYIVDKEKGGDIIAQSVED